MTHVIVKTETPNAEHRRPELRVPSDARRKMIESAVTLLAMRGLQGTAFSDVLERSGAPRGSIYHHFPEGKDQLVEAAIELSGERALSVLDAVDGRPPKEVTAFFLDVWREVLVRSGLRTDSSPSTTLETTTAARTQPVTTRHRRRYYRLRPGETISDVAIRFKTTVAALLALNPKIQPTNLNVGERIRVR